MTTNPRGFSATDRGRLLPAAALVCLLCWAPHSARAQTECPYEIPPGGSITLTEDIGPCDEATSGGPVMKIEGPVKVDFDGHKVICNADIAGIEVTGGHVFIKNGIVKNCGDGIDLVAPDDAEGGHHKIIRMIVKSHQTDFGDRAFRVEEGVDNNYLAHNAALRFNGEGFRIEGDRNRLVHNTAFRNQNHGFRVEGNDNKLTRNLARRVGSEEDGGEGFRVEGTGNRLDHNTALKSQDEGYRIREDGQDNTLVRNVAQGNGMSDGEAGIRIQGIGNVVSKNMFVGNAGDGILLGQQEEEDDEEAEVTEEGSDNRVDRNLARSNGSAGIRVGNGAGDNRIDRNTAGENGETDLVDENLDPPCDDNEWTRNRFGTASQGCIQ